MRSTFTSRVASSPVVEAPANWQTLASVTAGITEGLLSRVKVAPSAPGASISIAEIDLSEAVKAAA